MKGMKIMLNIEIYAGIKPIITLSENVSDVYIKDGHQIDINEAAAESFPDGYGFISYEVTGFICSGDTKITPLIRELNTKHDNINENDMVEMAKLFKDFLTGRYKLDMPVCIVFDCLMLSSNIESAKRFFNIVYSGAKNAYRPDGTYPNTIIFINKESVPLKEDSFVASIPIPFPTQAQRAELMSSITGEEYDDRTISLTEGLTNRDLLNICAISKRDSKDIFSSAQLYLYRTKENPYLHCRERFSSWHEIYEELRKEIFGQDELLKTISKRLFIRIHSDSKQPLFLFFSGSTGTGKTQTAKILTKILFASEENMSRIDMSGYASPESMWNLTGSPYGYRDSEKGGKLTNSIKTRPFSVLLFDEIEKADKTLISTVFLPIIDEGVLNITERLCFQNAILIFTSNLGFHGHDDGLSDEERVNKALYSHFPPEFLSRLKLGTSNSSVLVFNRLTSDIAAGIVEKTIAEDAENDSSTMPITFDEKAKSLITQRLMNSDPSRFGARMMLADYQTIKGNIIISVGKLCGKCEVTADRGTLIAKKITDKGEEIYDIKME